MSNVYVIVNILYKKKHLKQKNLLKTSFSILFIVNVFKTKKK